MGGGTDKYAVIKLYEEDIEKIRDIIKDNNSVVVCGYCILLTTSDIDKDCTYCKDILKANLETRSKINKIIEYAPTSPNEIVEKAL